MKFLYRLIILAALCLPIDVACQKQPIPDEKEKEEEKTMPVEDLVVFYEANPKVFASSAALSAISERLPEIKKLGTTILWLMPINRLGSLKSVGSPYCVRDYKAVNPSYGTNEDLKSLVTKAHSMGMKVVMDWVANHTSWDNAWITEHPEWYTQENGVIISPKGTNWADVADLNYDNKDMRAAMTDAMIYWIKEIGIDGYRCDAVDYVPVDYWTEAIAAIRKTKSDAIMLAESSDMKYFNAGFDYAYGWPYQNALKGLFGNGNIDAFYTKVNSEQASLPEGKHLMRFITNHDQASENAPSSVYGSVSASIAAHVITSFIGEYPLIYSSQEIGYSKPLNFFNVNVMDWDSNKSVTESYQKIMAAALESNGARYGKPVLSTIGKCVCIWWKNGPKGLLVLVNTSNTTLTAKIPMERAGEKMKDLLTGEETSVPSVVEIGPYQYKIWYKQ
ncbi:MAG: alpha-amylase [Bacteroidales bacterium]|nr:alpha-amylase [Bacteroidales bacterium]